MKIKISEALKNLGTKSESRILCFADGIYYLIEADKYVLEVIRNG